MKFIALASASVLGWTAVTGAHGVAPHSLAVAPLHETAGVAATEDPLANALAAVRRDPSNPEVHAAAALAAREAEAADRALFHARFALAATRGDRAARKLVTDMEAIVTELDPLGSQPDAELARHLDHIVSLGESALTRKLWANAVDFFLRTAGTPADEAAQKGLDRIYSNAEAAPALVRSGLDVPVVGGRSRMSPRQIEAFDRDNLDWAKASKNKRFDVEGYKIRTNMGYEVGERIGFAMTQINEFLRGMYRHKEAGQRMRGCEIVVYRTHEEWRANEFTPEEIKAGVGGPSMGGFFSPSDNYISTYDQRTVGRSMDDLWETLFHEASHQFSSDVTKSLIPAWVEEGVACYMEGVALLPNGALIANQIAESRLEALLQMMRRGPDPIVDVITYFQPGSYSGMYYPWGWGLIYFIRNFEDENSERVYLPYFDEYMKQYKGDGKHDVWGRFEEYFITKPKRPGIDDFEAWNRQWRAWIEELGELHFGGPEQADKLLSRAAKQMANGKEAQAVETYVWSLRKRPYDPVAMLGMAEACLATKRDDTALYYFRKLFEWTNAQSDSQAQVEGLDTTVDALRARTIEGMRKINRTLADSMVGTRSAFEEKIADLAQSYVEAELPLAGAQLVLRAQDLIGSSVKLAALEKRLRDEHAADARLERELVVDDALTRWDAVDPALWRKGEGNTLVSIASRDAAAIIAYDAAPDRPRYRFEATLSLNGENMFPVFGVLYGERVGSSRQLGYIPFEGLCEFRMRGEEPDVEERISRRFIVAGEKLALAIEVDGNRVEYFVDGKSVLTKFYPDSELRGRVGFFAWNTEMTVSDMRLVY